MRGAARAIAWEFQRRHRLGLVVFGVYLVAFWAIKSLAFGPGAPIRLNPPDGLAGLVIGPLTITYFYFVGVFSYGLAGDLGARESAFPRRMFTLPVPSIALAGLPMLYGTVTSMTLWLATAFLSLWTGGLDIDLPWIWPALLMATFLAWMQALTWMSYPLRSLRVVAAVLLLTSIDAVVMLAIYSRAKEATMVAILAPALAAAYVVGIRAVARARRGDVPDWRRAVERFGGAGAHTPRKTFASPARAQAWLEWRRHGRTLPLLVAYVVPCELLLLFLPGNDTAGLVFLILFIVLITPSAMALLAAPALSTFSTHDATRPLTNVALVAAKLEMTLRSTLAAWLLVAVFVVGSLPLSGAMPVVVDKMKDFAEYAGPVRATLITLLVFAALVASTWKNLVQSLAVGLTGRPWVIKSSVLLALLLLTAAFPLLWLVVRNDRVQSFVWDYLPWILAALVWLKVSLGAWIAIRLLDRKVLSDRAVIMGAVVWLAAVALVYGVLAWIAASPVFPFYFVAAIAILLVPLARLSAAPLALAWSRHR